VLVAILLIAIKSTTVGHLADGRTPLL